MILRINKKMCCQCGECIMIFPGAPDSCFGAGVEIPKWAESAFRGAGKVITDICPFNAIFIEESE